MRDWKVLGAVAEGESISVCGIDIWQSKWQAIDEPSVKLPHPSYPEQLHEMKLYRVTAGAKSVIFAAAELSAGVYGFYVPA